MRPNCSEVARKNLSFFYNNAVSKEKSEFKFNAKKIPTLPGCYLYWDKDDTLLYVGKAKNLRKRVSSYFAKKHDNPRTQTLVKHIARIETQTVSSEYEALVLENNLIKQHAPRYNVRLKDDKNFVYLRITKEEYPKLEITRRLIKDGSTYLGPRTSTKAFRNLIRFCQRYFRVNMVKPGQDYYVHQLLDQKDDTPQAYNERIELMKQFLNGRTKAVQDEIKERMMRFAGEKNFEAAAKMRDLLQSIDVSLDKQTVQFADGKDRDFVHFVREGHTAYCVQTVYRDGKLLYVNEIPFRADTTNEDPEVIEQFLVQYYPRVSSPPKEIYLPVLPEAAEEVTRILEEIFGSSVALFVPQKGDKKAALDLAEQNAKQFLRRMQVEEASSGENFAKALPALAKILGIKELRRAECFDISHFSGQDTVASQAVFIDGKPATNQYRKFKVQTLPDGQIDDFAAMEEILLRRFARADDPKFAEKFPDLIIIDGGKGQLSAVMKAVKAASKAKTFPKTFRPTKQIIALAKREEEIFCVGKKEPLILEPDSPELHLLQRIRDEAHRFAITFQRQTRGKTALHSPLDDVPQIGAATKKKLLKTFESLSGIREASDADLLKVINARQLKSLRRHL